MKEHEKLDRSFNLFWNLDLDKLRDELNDEQADDALRQLEDMVMEFDDVHHAVMSAVESEDSISNSDQ